MIFQVKIINVSQTFKGKSATTGREWASKSILLGFEDEDGCNYIRAQVAENIWNEYALQVGDVGCIALKFRTIQSRMSNYVYNDIRIVPLPNRQ